MSKEIIYNEEARQKMRAGVDKVANAVKVTLGPRGRNVIIKKGYPKPDITKDGVTVAREIVLEDPFEDIGAQLCKQVAMKTNDVVGDGTTTATVLTQAMVNEGMKYVATGANAVSIKRGIDKATEKIVEFIENQKKMIDYSSKQEIINVATISGNDSEVGNLVAEAFSAVGPNGIVTFEESKFASTTLETIEGFQFDRGFLSPYFVTNPDKMICEYEDCLILFWGKRINNPHEMLALLNSVAATKKPLLIVADDLETEALATLILNKVQGTLKVVAIKAPGFGERKNNLMEDMALLTGTKYFSDQLGTKLESVLSSELGTAKKVIVTKDSTTIIGGGGDKDAIDKHIAGLKIQIAEAEDKYDKEKLIERIAKLSGSVALLKIGAISETELQEKKYRYEDAISATKAALEQGIVDGGGATLYRARKALTKLKLDDPDEMFGVSIVAKALEMPLTTILDNAGFNKTIRNKIFLSVERNKGYNGKTGKTSDSMISIGIVDPVKVVKSTIQGAASIAGLFLTCEAAIVEKPSDNPAPMNPYAGMY